MQPIMIEGLDQALTRATKALQAARKIAVLTGAGVSAESGLATFRGAGGLWEGHRVDEVATPEAFHCNPELVWRFYNARRAGLQMAKPNAGHFALAALEKSFGVERFTLITQNVDGFHRDAGSRHVLELHGTLRRVRCTGCGAIEDRGTEPLDELPDCQACGALLRPDVVWFNEALPEKVWLEAEAAACECDCFLIAGTSAMVFPAAGLIDHARRNGATVIEVNLELTAASSRADVTLFGPSGEILPLLAERLESSPASS